MVWLTLRILRLKNVKSSFRIRGQACSTFILRSAMNKKYGLAHYVLDFLEGSSQRKNLRFERWKTLKLWRSCRWFIEKTTAWQ